MDDILNRRTNGTVTAVVTVLTVLCGAGYAIGMWFLGRRWAHQARTKAFTLNKWPRRLVPGPYTPIVPHSNALTCALQAFHICLTLSSLLEVRLYKVCTAPWLYGSSPQISLDGWLLGQYRYTGRYATVGSRDGIRASLYVWFHCIHCTPNAEQNPSIAAIWTLLFSIAFTIMFLHPSLWRHPIASAGAQAVWILFTWCVWVAATATMNRALPLVSAKARCAGVEYCGQLRAAFGMLVVLCRSSLLMAFLHGRPFIGRSVSVLLVVHPRY